MVAISRPHPIPGEERSVGATGRHQHGAGGGGQAGWSPDPGRAPGGDEFTRPGRGAPHRLPDRATRVRRRRLAVVVLAAVLLAGGMASAQVVGAVASSGEPGGAVPTRSAETERPRRPVAGAVYVVQPGDTIWTIAAELSPDGDVRPVVDRLQARHGGAELDVGDRLVLDVE